MNKFFTLFAAALIAVSALSGPVFAQQRGDHTKQQDPAYFNAEMRNNGKAGQVESADLGKGTQKDETVRAYLPN